MGPRVFTSTLPQQHPAPRPTQPEEDSWDALIRAQLERVNALDKRPPMYTDEEVAQRRAQNEREYDVGLYGMLSGNKDLAELGGTVFKNALGLRTPKVTERGTVDQITGDFKYDTDYLRKGEQDKLDNMMRYKAQSDDRRAQQARDQAFREWQLGQTFGNQVFLKTLGAQIAAGGGGAGAVGVGPAQQVGVDKDGNAVWRPTGKAGGATWKYGPDGRPMVHEGPVLPKPSSAGASEDEKKMASNLLKAEQGWSDMQKILKATPNASEVPAWERVVESTFTKHGPDIVNKFRDAPRQQFIAASNDLAQSLLRAATGAGYSIPEATMEINSIVPTYGEKPETTAQKMAKIPIFLQGLRVRAGRAAMPQVPGANVPPVNAPGAQPTAATPGAAGADGLTAEEAAELAERKKRMGGR